MSWPPELPVVRVHSGAPTDRLDEVVTFYRDGLGLKELRHFAAHYGYTASCSASPAATTTSSSPRITTAAPCPAPSVDNLLVLYLEYAERGGDRRRPRLSDTRLSRVEPENPYWDGRSITIADPDGWRVVLDWGLAEE